VLFDNSCERKEKEIIKMTKMRSIKNDEEDFQPDFKFFHFHSFTPEIKTRVYEKIKKKF
jgi:hypothetical protein